MKINKIEPPEYYVRTGDRCLRTLIYYDGRNLRVNPKR